MCAAIPAPWLRWPAFLSSLSSSSPPWRITPISLAVETALRKTILLAYRTCSHKRLETNTCELILRGSRRWSVFLLPFLLFPDWHAAWWDLPGDLERELRHCRECVVNTLASVPRHFIRIYSSHGGSSGGGMVQCQRGYESSPACDVFQLGQLVRFLVRKGLVYIFDFGPSSFTGLSDSSLVNASELVALLKECPGYHQLDRRHASCGPRAKLEPILGFLEFMLASHAIPMWTKDWGPDPAGRDSWLAATERQVVRFDNETTVRLF